MKEFTKLYVTRRLLKSRSFIVVLDNESYLALKVKDPMKMEDLLTLSEQRASLALLREQLTGAIKQFDKRLASFEPKKPKRTTKSAPKKA